MKTKVSLLMLLMSLIMTTTFSQEKSKKELKEEESQQRQIQIETLVNSKDFVFVARYAMPMGCKHTARYILI